MSDNKTVAFFIPSLDAGGAERVMIELANRFSNHGFDTHLCVVTAKGRLRKEVSPSVKIVDLCCSRTFLAALPFYRWLKSNKPKAIFSTHGHANIIAFAANSLLRSKGKLILRESSTPSKNLLSLGSNWKINIFKKMLSYVYNRADVIVAPSQSVSEDICRYLGVNKGRISVIYNPVISKSLFTKSAEKVSHKWLNNRSYPVILSVGRLTEAKDYKNLLTAYQLLLKNIDSRLIILGEGEDRLFLEKIIVDLGIEDKVCLEGFVSNPFKYMSKVDLYVMSSKWEGLPNSLIQAMALGVKVVSTDCPSGPGEVLNNGEFGFLVPVSEPRALALAMETALGKEEGKKKPDSNWLAKYDAGKIAESYFSLV